MIWSSLVLAAFASAALAQQSSPEADLRLRAVTAESYVNERLGIWKQRLDLADWKISVTMSRRCDLKPGTLGSIHWDKNKKSAAIQVLDVSEYHLPVRDMLDDMEFTVVHELIHIELSSLPRSEASRSDEEHAVNGLARALILLDRQKQPPQI
jgi:hypothetical protein